MPSARNTRPARSASPRVLAAAGAVVAVAIVSIALTVVLGGGKAAHPSVPAVGTLENALPGAAEVDGLFRGIPQQGMRLGKASAPVTLIEYLDLQCPSCREVETRVLPDVITRFVRSGDAKLLVRPLAFVGADSARGRKAMIAAARQNRAFNFAHLLYVNQGTENTGWLDDTMVAAVAASIPQLRVHTLLDDRNSAGVSTSAAKYDSLAVADNVDATPTFMVGSSVGGRMTLVAPSAAALAAAVDSALRR